MDNLQIEKGYTQMSNEIMEIAAMTNFSGAEFRVLLVIWRNTYGWKRKEYALSENFIAKASNLNERSVRRILKKLISNNILVIIKPQTNKNPRVIAFNKDSDKWDISYSREDNSTPSREDNSTPSREDSLTPSGEDSLTPSGEDSLTPSRKILEIIKNTAVVPDIKTFEDNASEKSREDSLTPQQRKELKESLKKVCKEREQKEENPHTFFQKFYTEKIGVNMPDELYNFCRECIEKGMDEDVIKHVIETGSSKDIPSIYIFQTLTNKMLKGKFSMPKDKNFDKKPAYHHQDQREYKEEDFDPYYANLQDI